MKDSINKICEFLNEILNQLLEFERETMEIMYCDVDSILRHTENRVSITHNIDNIFSEIEKICNQIRDGEELWKIIKNVSAYTKVKPEHEDVFFKAQQIFSIVNRIKDSDVQAVSRINFEKDVLIKKIREINKGQGAKASKFMVGTEKGGNKHFLGNNKTI